MEQLFQRHRPDIKKFLTGFLGAKEKELSKVNRWGKDLMKRLLRFSLQGKMLRGSMVVISYLLFKKGVPQTIVKIASALEITHSALIIHDDIMDRESMRRGDKSIYNQYKELAEQELAYDPYHFGVSQAICAGDIGFFLAYEILATLKIGHELTARLITLWSKELSSVALAQMQDIYFGSSQPVLREEDIIKLYLYKTARYTFSLPLVTGGLVAGEDHKTLQILEELGEYMGVIYQIRDDELNLFGKEEETGKPVGTDLRERKKTLYHLYLTEVLSDEEKKIIENIIQKSTLSQSALREVRRLIERSGVVARIRNKAHEMKSEAERLIEILAIGSKKKDILREILHFTYERNR